MDNLDTLADLLRDMTYRELMDVADFLSNVVVDADTTTGTDFAQWLLSWADARDEASTKEPTE